jgi:4-amino-4-deoxy-L-arabinose transferase-like glycosyltransferase
MSFAVVALAVALRVLWVLCVPTKPVGDFAMYVESAAHLASHGGFDSEYIFMPGYIFLIAPVQALGGGWLTTKLVGAILGGLGAGAMFGITRRLTKSARTALVAGLLYAFWPAGIAIASVTGTDMPAAVLVVVAVYFLVRFAEKRPLLAALLFGLFTGVGAFIRAIVIPLAGLAVLVFRAYGKSWKAATAYTAVACATAVLLLSPWMLRNRLRYGEAFLTDSHGGHTALVGANPNTDGCYSRSLNRMYHDVTGFTLLAEPHRQADHAALGIAKKWIAFEPLFALGLLGSKAERLLVHERALLYWPLFRAGVLPEPEHSFFARHRSFIEGVADYYWLTILALALMGIGISCARRQWLVLSLLPQIVALMALYTLIFAEPRYRLPMTMLLMPMAAMALAWLGNMTVGIRQRALPTSWKRETALALGLAAAVFVTAPALAWAAGRLREHHRWAVSECEVASKTQLCQWRSNHATSVEPAIRGVWNGIGIALPSTATAATAESEIALAAGTYELSADIDGVPAAAELAGTITIFANERPLSPELSLADVVAASKSGKPIAWHAIVDHPGGTLHLRVDVAPSTRNTTAAYVWLSNVRLTSGP